MAYQEFLRANGINPEDLSQKEYSDLLNTQDMYNDDLIHFSKSENCKDVGTFPTEAPGSPGMGWGQGRERAVSRTLCGALWLKIAEGCH